MTSGNPQWDAFEALAARLVCVPKLEIDEAREVPEEQLQRRRRQVDKDSRLGDVFRRIREREIARVAETYSIARSQLTPELMALIREQERDARRIRRVL